MRGWHVEVTVRPDHRMVAHTAFLVVARRLADICGAPGAEASRVKTTSLKRIWNAWIPMNAMGEREVTDKKIRCAARDAKNLAAPTPHVRTRLRGTNGTVQNDSAAAEATESAE